MSLEQAVAALTAAVEANTAAIKAGGGSKPTSTPGYKPKYDKPQMQAALEEVKQKKGTPAAKAIIKEVGGVDKMSDINDAETIDKVYEAAKKAAEDDGM